MELFHCGQPHSCELQPAEMYNLINNLTHHWSDLHFVPALPICTASLVSFPWRTDFSFFGRFFFFSGSPSSLSGCISTAPSLFFPIEKMEKHSVLRTNNQNCDWYKTRGNFIYMCYHAASHFTCQHGVPGGKVIKLCLRCTLCFGWRLWPLCNWGMSTISAAMATKLGRVKGHCSSVTKCEGICRCVCVCLFQCVWARWSQLSNEVISGQAGRQQQAGEESSCRA